MSPLQSLVFYLLVAVIIGLPLYVCAAAPRQTMTMGQTLLAALMHLMLWSPIHGLVAVVIGVGMGLLMQSVELGVMGLVASLVLTSFTSVQRNIKKRHLKKVALHTKLTAALPRIDYFFEGEDAGIAADSVSGKVAVVHGDALSIQALRIADICRMRAVQSSLEEINLIGSASTTQHWQVFGQNQFARQKHQATTGLELELNDIQCPSVIVPMTFRGAEQWLRVLEQMRDGALKPTASPTQLPAV